MTRLRAFLIVALLWAAIYLPGLGSTEIKGEEGRRILPAITMLDEGDWLVPHVGGKAFLRKPPLVNWMIAGSFKMLDRRDEWAARLPSALCVLALCGVMLAVSGARTRTMFTTDVMFVAAVFAMTQFGLLAKARFAGAEIEGIYVPLAGMAVVTWLAWWEQQRAAWLTWTVPFIFLGLAGLAKGPVHLLFFYALVVAVLWQAKGLAELRRAPHFAGIAIMLGIVALWAVPYFQAHPEAAKVWNDQMAGRVTENKFDAASYALNIPRGLSDALPWLLFAPVLWTRRAAWTGREGALVRGALLAVAGCFFILLLIPGVLTRYVLPLGIPMALLLALALAEEKHEPPRDALRRWWNANAGGALGLLALAIAAPTAVAVGAQRYLRFGGVGTFLVWPILASSAVIIICLVVFIGRKRLARPTRLAGASAALFGAAAMLYAAAAVPFINLADNLRPLAAAIDGTIPSGKRLYLFDPEYQPAIFYLRTPYSYANAIRELPAEARYILARAGNRKKLESERPEFELAQDFGGGGKNQILLFRRR
ncbi:MAG: phospholipid carrier-dependent glycosyltransferase, partial [Chthoniobacteraceae bacterium]